MRTEIWLALGIIVGAVIGWAYGRAEDALVIGTFFGILAGAMTGLFLRMALPPKYKKKPPQDTDQPPEPGRKSR